MDRTATGAFDEICGYAEIPDPSHPGELQVHFAFPVPIDIPFDYWILDTDYESFASVYTCVDVIGIIRIEFAWIMVRDPQNVTYEIMNKALDAYKNQNITTSTFLPVSHENCGDYENPNGDDPCSGGGWGK